MKYWAKLLTALLGISFLVFGGIKANGQELSGEQKDVWKMEEASWKLFKQGDLKGYLALWHKDALMWRFAALSPGPKGYYESLKIFPFPWEKIPGRETISYQLAWPTINIINNIALVYYRCSIEGVKRPPFSGRVIHVWMKQEGKWQLIGGMNARE
jgi:hypothetical protein